MPRRIVMYATRNNLDCVQARALLALRRIPYDEIDASDPLLRAQVARMSCGRRSLPQFFIGGVPIGGFDELRELVRRDRLVPLLYGVGGRGAA